MSIWNSCTKCRERFRVLGEHTEEAVDLICGVIGLWLGTMEDVPKIIELGNYANDAYSIYEVFSTKEETSPKLSFFIQQYSTEGPGLAFEKYVDDNGNLSQQGIMNAMGRANPSVEVKPDYFEKTLGHAILKELKEDEDYIHYILGRAQIGGGLGQHWVVIEDYSVTEQGVIRYECVGSSDNDAGREFTSDPNAASGTNKKLACVDKIEVYSVR